jgi:squalene-hopene/tetraprenyl-beta-curcumene cyclase
MTLLFFSVFLAAAPGAFPIVDDKAPNPPARRLARPTADEPKRSALSLKQSAQYLDNVAVEWTRKRNCGTCHTNVPYLMARPVLKEFDSPGQGEVRAFFETRVAHWDDPDKDAKPRWDAEVISTAQALAMNDAATTGKLHPLTRKALDRMWTLQTQDGGWDWLKCAWPPYEHDDYYGAIAAALATGYAPEDYAHGPSARPGLERLRSYFRKTPPPDLHHRSMLLWASTRLGGLMDRPQQEATIRAIRAIQRSDGGWCLPSLGGWKRRDGTANDPGSPSDGFASGMLVFILREAGVPATDPTITRGVAWLKANQRVSGRWFTRSLTNDQDHFIADAGTAFAVMALRACETHSPATAERSSPALRNGSAGRIIRVAAAAGQATGPRPVVLEGWGEVVDPDGDCKLTLEGDRLAILVPGRLHDLQAEAEKSNAPRVLREVEGDFVAVVKVVSKLEPSGEGTRQGGSPSNGAGLLLWKSDGNYIRLERAAVARDRSISHYVLVQQWKDRDPTNRGSSVPDGPMLLRLSRKGNEVSASASMGGQHWHDMGKLTVDYPAKLKIGVAAVNSASQPFTAELTEFQVKESKDAAK